MHTIHLSHSPLAEVKPRSLLLIGPTRTDAEQYFAIAVHRVGDPSATHFVSFRADRGSLRAVRTELCATQQPERLVLDLGPDFTLEPNPQEPVRTRFCEHSALRPGDLLVHGSPLLLVAAPARDTRPLVVDLDEGELTELTFASVAVVRHWNIYVHTSEGQRICLVDTTSHKQASRPELGCSPRRSRSGDLLRT